MSDHNACHSDDRGPCTGTHPASAACKRPDLDAWAPDGGPLPASLAAHLPTCPACAAQVRRISTVHAGLTLLRTQAMPVGMSRPAGDRALRMLRRAARASEAAKRLLAMRPELNRWQRTRIHLARISVGAAAAVLLVMVRVGLLSGFEHTREAGQLLAAKHWERHIDPGGEMMGPRSFT